MKLKSTAHVKICFFVNACEMKTLKRLRVLMLVDNSVITRLNRSMKLSICLHYFAYECCC